MSSFLDIFDRLSLSLLQTFKRFPLATLSSFLATLIWVLLIEINYNQNHEVTILANKIAFVLSMGLFLFPVLHLFNRSIWFKLIGVAILLAYFYSLPVRIGMVDLLRHALLLLALFFMFFWAPFLNNKISNKNIWEWTMKILLVLFATVILTITLYSVFLMVMYGLYRLFEVEVDARRYAQFAIMVVGLFSVNFFLSQLPKYICLLQLKKYTKIGAVFTKYVLTPTMIIYMLILFSYIIKVIVLQKWESITVDWMIISFSSLAITTYMFWTPLTVEINRTFRKLIWGATLLLSMVLGLSIWIRLEQGLDLESIYLIALFDIWLFSISSYFLFFKNASYKWLFFSITMLIVISESTLLLI